MARVKNVDIVMAKIRRDLKNSLNNKVMLEEIGKFSVERMRGFARRGKPLSDIGSFPQLQASSIKTRKRLAKFNNTHATFSEKRSNLTFTGQLLEALRFKIVAPGRLDFRSEGRRKSLRTGPKSSARITPTNSRNEILSRVLADRGFVFIGMDELGIRRIRNIALKHIRQFLRKVA